MSFYAESLVTSAIYNIVAKSPITFVVGGAMYIIAKNITMLMCDKLLENL